MMFQERTMAINKYEPSKNQLNELDSDTLSQTKQEEKVTKKKVELIKTKQIATRVKRQLVLEDGKIVEDSGPLVTTTTNEDTDKQETEHTEDWNPVAGEEENPPPAGWVAIDSHEGNNRVISETVERKVTTHDEVEDIFETEEVQHLGNMSNMDIIRSIRDGVDVREAARDSLVPLGYKAPEKRILNKSKRHDRTTDIEDTTEVARCRKNGSVVREISRRLEHEEFHNDDIPDDEHGYEYNEGIYSANRALHDSSIRKGSPFEMDRLDIPTPPPRSRRSYSRPSPTPTEHFHRPDTRSTGRSSGTRPSSYINSPIQVQGDYGERKSYERAEHSFGNNDGYVSKQDHYYRTSEDNNPEQGDDAEVTERKTVERRQKNFNYSGPSQGQFHPKYILGSRNTTIGRLQGHNEKNELKPLDHLQPLDHTRMSNEDLMSRWGSPSYGQHNKSSGLRSSSMVRDWGSSYEGSKNF